MSTTGNSRENFPLIVRPATPFDLQYSNLTATSVLLTWTAGTGGIEVYDYWVVTYNYQYTDGNVTFLQLNNLSPNSYYFYRIYARGINGEYSLDSTNIVSFTTPALSVPPSPVNLRATSITDTSITLQWDTGTDGSAVVFRYRIYQDGIWTQSTTANAITIINLSPVTTYQFYIVSEGSDGQFGVYASNAITPTTNALSRPSSPVNLRTTAVSTGSVTLQWDNGTDGTEPVSFFRVLQNGAFFSNIIGYNTIINALTPNVLYTFSVVAVAANGQESASASNPLEVIVGTAPALRPATPLSASYQPINTTTVQLNIIPGSGGGVVNGFATLEIYSQMWFYSPGSNPLIRADNLTPGRSYQFLVFAVGRDGQRSSGYAMVSFTLPLGIFSNSPW